MTQVQIQHEQQRQPWWYDLYQVQDKTFQYYCSIAYELFGTFFFTYGYITANNNNYLQAVCMGTWIWFAFQTSAAQYNPAITLNMALRQKLDYIECIVLTFTQVAGVFAAAFCARAVYGVASYPQVTSVLCQDMDVQLIQAFFEEVCGTFMLVTLVNVQTTKECTFTENKGLVGPLFVFIYFTTRIYTGQSMGLINPAFGIGLPVVGEIYRNDFVSASNYPNCSFDILNKTQDSFYIQNQTIESMLFCNESFTPQFQLHRNCSMTYNTYQGLNQCWIWIVGSYCGGLLAFLFFQYLYYPTILRVKNKI